jgi:PAS domain S-box-containing protein
MQTDKARRTSGHRFRLEKVEAPLASEVRLNDAERELRQTLDSIPVITWRAAANGYVQQLNKRWFEYTGTTPEQVRGWRWKTCIHPDDLASLVETGRRYVAAGKSIDAEARLRRFDGTYRWFLFRPAPARDDTGKLVGWYGTITDVEDQKLVQGELRRSEAELAHVTRVMSLGALTASIAHEVNQPLSGIITNANTCLRMLAANPPNLDGARETALRTIRDGNRAVDVIARLRALFSNKETPTDTLDLNEVAREVLGLVSGDLLRNRVILRAELNRNPSLVTGDRVQLQQVTLNLVRNALDAMNEVNDFPRHLLVRVEKEEEGGARLTVRDSGVGLESQSAEKLFDAFYTTKNNGMGIGLSISRSIVENHGGKLWAEANDGPGATFAFSVPR